MVMIFQSEKARRFLLENGVVFTFRAKRRKKLGRDWITDRRGGRKNSRHPSGGRGKVQASRSGLYVEYSGFSTLEEWIGEIKKLNGGRLPSGGWLYKVTLLSTSPNTED